MMPASMKTNDQQPTAATMDTQMKEQLRHSRNAAWLAQTGLSLVAVVALTTGSEYDSREFEERWSLAMTSMALIMGFMGAALHIFHIIGDSVFSSTRTGSSAMEEESQFVSSPLEAGLVSISFSLLLPIPSA